MKRSSRPVPAGPLGLNFFLLTGLLAILWLAGGASRADALGQVVVRSASWLAIAATLAFGPKPRAGEAKPVVLILAVTIAIVLVQLVPLPPAAWSSLAGRDLFEPALAASGSVQSWRPLAIVPDGAINAAGSLVVPAAVLLLALGLTQRARTWLPGVMLALIVGSMLLGLLQFSGGSFGNPFVNDVPGDVSGTFANRNHFALFLAIGCLIAPVWAFTGRDRLAARAALALGLVVVLLLTIIASGSRAGMVLGFVAFAVGLAFARTGLRRASIRLPAWILPTIGAVAIATVGLFVLAIVTANRALSIDRLLESDPTADLRVQALPTILEMIRTYFPFGSGFGSFDPMFRIAEPFSFLILNYLNHAHNDYLEIVLEGGLPGLLVLIAALCWLAIRTVGAWRSDACGATTRLGSSILLLVAGASAVDYPARTPLIMAMVMIAALWTVDTWVDRRGTSLPSREQQL